MKFSITPHETWMGLYEKPEAKAALNKIEEELDGKDFYPLPEDVLRFMTTDLSKVRYVLVGQDPYDSYDENGDHPQATGRSFEVHELIGKTWCDKIEQASLRNILKAVYLNEIKKEKRIGQIRKSIKDGSFVIAPPSAWFDSLEQQGMLFLNATLTVPPDNPGGHHELWKDFRKLVIQYIERENPTAQWVLWGKDTRKLCKKFLLPQAYESAIKRHHPARHEFVQNSGMEKIKVDWTGQPKTS